ncbi:unnamed protein product [Peniophora sp. CBMAI 1063]|nr:unnamed protein product [Peniophora sp. CBMAI 1063]
MNPDTSSRDAGRRSVSTRRFPSSPAIPSSSNIFRREDGLAVSLDDEGDDEPVSLLEDLGSDFSSVTASNSSAHTEPSASPPRMGSPTSAPRLRTSSSARSWVESQVAFGEHRRMLRRQTHDAPHKSKGKAPQQARSGSYRRRSLETGMVHTPLRPLRRRQESLLAIMAQYPIVEGQPHVMLGDSSGRLRADPIGLDVTMEELALFDAMAAHASAAYRREEYVAHEGHGYPRSGAAGLQNDEEVAAREVYRAMQDGQLAHHAASPGATYGTPAGSLVSPPNLPAYLEESDTTEDVRREDAAMVDIWHYIYSVIRRSPSQRMCAYLQVSADDTREVLRQVAENAMCCTLHRRGTEWWVAVVDRDDADFLEAFVERRMAEVALDQGGRQVLKLPWGADPLVVDEAVQAATGAARVGSSAPQWPTQYTTGRIHFLVAWLDLEW